MLLREPRSPEAQQAVQKVIDSSAVSSDKVRRIEEIDRRNADEGETPQPRGTSRRAEQQQTRRRYVAADPQSEPAVPRIKARRPPRVTAPLRRTSYLQFFFRHRLRIREFGATTGTIRGGGFPPSVRTTEQVPAFFSGFLRPAARDVSHLLTQLMGNAWMYLTKKEYNLLVLVLDLCDRIDRVSADSAQYRDGSILPKLAPVEDRLLSIRYSDDSVPRVLQAIGTLITHNRREIENLASLPQTVGRMISRTDGELSLIDALLALNMVAYRSYLSEADLILSGLGSLVETRTFDCSDPTMDRIEEFVRRLESQLEALDQEFRSVLKVRALVKKDENGEIELDPLKRLVTAGTGYSWETVLANPPQLAETLFSGIREQLWEITAAPVALEAVGTTRLFAGAPFDAELERLGLAAGNIRDRLTELQLVSRERLASLREKREKASRHESEFLMQLQLGLDIIISVRDRLSPFLEHEVPPSHSFQPVDITAGRDPARGLPLAAPFCEGSRFAGTSLRSVLELIVTEAHLICFVFGDRRIRHLLSREHQFQRDMEHILESVERIAVPEQAIQILQKYRR
jgi:hypothetical protein